MNVEEKRQERIEFAIELLCVGLPRLEIQKQIREKFNCNHNTARQTVTQSLDKLGEGDEKFNETDSKIGFIEQKYHEMLKRAESLKGDGQRMNMELSILRDLGSLIGANHHIKEKIVLNIQNNPPAAALPARTAINNALKKLNSNNDQNETIIEVSQNVADVLTQPDGE